MENTDKKIALLQKLSPLLAAITAALLILYPLQLLKYLLLNNFMHTPVTIVWKCIIPSLAIGYISNDTLIFNIANVLFHYTAVVIIIEILNPVIFRVKTQLRRTYFVFVQFSLVTFFFFSFILFVVSYVGSFSINSDWDNLFLFLPREFNMKLVLSLCIVFIIFGYISLLLTRLKNQFSDFHTE
jgi:hypothetical protein